MSLGVSSYYSWTRVDRKKHNDCALDILNSEEEATPIWNVKQWDTSQALKMPADRSITQNCDLENNACTYQCSDPLAVFDLGMENGTVSSINTKFWLFKLVVLFRIRFLS